ncbi:MAG: ABC transporter permease subunit [Rhodoblastus sp.]|jgi:NitT/TauT family transport system permease protein
MRPAGRLLWGAIGLAAVWCAWAWGAHALGPFVLPRPADAATRLVELFASGEAFGALASTATQALAGWIIACCVGFALALVAAFAAPVEMALRPIATVLLGVPPVAWLVLALLWLGPAGAAPAFTTAVANFPVVFVAALQGLAARDPDLDEMAESFRASPRQRFTDILFPQVLDHLLPAMATALGFSWKVCVMAEVMSSGTGIGARLATARAHLDLPETMAWIMLVMALVLVCDLMLVAPLRAWLGRLRGADRTAPAHA